MFFLCSFHFGVVCVGAEIHYRIGLKIWTASTNNISLLFLKIYCEVVESRQHFIVLFSKLILRIHLFGHQHSKNKKIDLRLKEIKKNLFLWCAGLNRHACHTDMVRYGTQYCSTVPYWSVTGMSLNTGIGNLGSNLSFDLWCSVQIAFSAKLRVCMTQGIQKKDILLQVS